MQNFFITLFCLFLLSCTTAQEIINRGEVKVGMSQDELRSVLLSTSLSEDPFLSGCFRQFFRNERALIVAAESRTTFFIFKNAYKVGTCKDVNNGTLEAVRYSYQSALNYIQNNFTYLKNNDVSINQNSNDFARFNTRKNIFIRDYKRKLVDLNYLEYDSRIDFRGSISEEFHTAIVKFLLDEGECDLAKIIMESEEIILLKGNNFNYCSNKIYSQDYKTSSGSTLDSRIIYLNYIFTDEFSTLLNKALKRVL